MGGGTGSGLHYLRMLFQANKTASLGLWSKRLYSEVHIIDVFLSTGRSVDGPIYWEEVGEGSYKQQLTVVLVIKEPLVKHLSNLL